MALRKCRDCGNRVSSRAKNCPQCGAPVKLKTHPLVGGLAFLLIIAVCAGVFTTAFKSNNGNPANSRDTAQAPESPPSFQGYDDYSVTVQMSGDLTICQVTFNSPPPTSDIAAEVVRHAVEELVAENSNREILAMAFNASGGALPDTYYGGALVYKPSDGRIRTMDERERSQTAEADEASYFIRIEDGRTARGITPFRRWLNVSIVFPEEPLGPEVKAAILKEIDKLESRRLDVNVYIYTGDKSNKVTWRQIRALNGKFMAVDYDSATGKISPNWNWE